MLNFGPTTPIERLGCVSEKSTLNKIIRYV
jgi:hypothetical protein